MADSFERKQAHVFDELQLYTLVNDYLGDKEKLQIVCPHIAHDVGITQQDLYNAAYHLIYSLLDFTKGNFAKPITSPQLDLISWFVDNYFTFLQNTIHKNDPEDKRSYSLLVFVSKLSEIHAYQNHRGHSLYTILYCIVLQFQKEVNNEKTQAVMRKLCLNTEYPFGACSTAIHFKNQYAFETLMVAFPTLQETVIEPCDLIEDRMWFKPNLLQIVCSKGTIGMLKYLYEHFPAMFEGIPNIKRYTRDEVVAYLHSPTCERTVEINDQISITVDGRKVCIKNPPLEFTRVYQNTVFTYSSLRVDVIKFMEEHHCILPFYTYVMVSPMRKNVVYSDFSYSFYLDMDYETLMSIINSLLHMEGEDALTLFLNDQLSQHLRCDCYNMLKEKMIKLCTLEEIESATFISKHSLIFDESYVSNSTLLNALKNERDNRVFCRMLDSAQTIINDKNIDEIINACLSVISISTLEQIEYLRSKFNLGKIDGTTLHKRIYRITEFEGIEIIITKLRENFEQKWVDNTIKDSFNYSIWSVLDGIKQKDTNTIIHHYKVLEYLAKEKFYLQMPYDIDINFLVVLYSLNLMSQNQILNYVTKPYEVRHLSVEDRNLMWKIALNIESVSQKFKENFEDPSNSIHITYEEEEKLVNEIIIDGKIHFPLPSKELVMKIFSYRLTYETFIAHITQEVANRNLLLFEKWFRNFDGKLPRDILERAKEIVKNGLVKVNNERLLRWLDKFDVV